MEFIMNKKTLFLAFTLLTAGIPAYTVNIAESWNKLGNTQQKIIGSLAGAATGIVGAQLVRFVYNCMDTYWHNKNASKTTILKSAISKNYSTLKSSTKLPYGPVLLLPEMVGAILGFTTATIAGNILTTGNWLAK